MLAEAKAESVVDPVRPTAASSWGGLTGLSEHYTSEQELSPTYCAVCDRDCESAEAFDKHLRGKPHMKKVTRLSGLLGNGVINHRETRQGSPVDRRPSPLKLHQ